MQVKQHREALLRLLEPGTTDESLRADMIMHHAAHGPRIQDSDMDGLDEDAAQRLRALQILQSTLGQTVGSSSPPTSPEMSPDISSPRSDHAIALHELRIHLPRLPPIRLLEAADSNEATRSFQKQGENDPFGSKAWPSAYLVAERLLPEVCGRSVLELGCGTGLVSIAAQVGGAKSVLATDRARQNLDCAQKSAKLNGIELDVEVFDVTSDLPLPCKKFKAFDFVVFSDVLYWPAEAKAFARRAAEAYCAGSTVIVADPGRRREDFLCTLQMELESHMDPESVPRILPQPTKFPDHVFDWVSKEVQTASSLFCQEPFILTLRPTTSDVMKGGFEIVD